MDALLKDGFCNWVNSALILAQEKNSENHLRHDCMSDFDVDLVGLCKAAELSFTPSIHLPPSGPSLNHESSAPVNQNTGKTYADVERSVSQNLQRTVTQNGGCRPVSAEVVRCRLERVTIHQVITSVQTLRVALFKYRRDNAELVPESDLPIDQHKRDEIKRQLAALVHRTPYDLKTIETDLILPMRDLASFINSYNNTIFHDYIDRVLWPSGAARGQDYHPQYMDSLFTPSAQMSTKKSFCVSIVHLMRCFLDTIPSASSFDPYLTRLPWSDECTEVVKERRVSPPFVRTSHATRVQQCRSSKSSSQHNQDFVPSLLHWFADNYLADDSTPANLYDSLCKLYSSFVTNHQAEGTGLCSGIGIDRVVMGFFIIGHLLPFLDENSLISLLDSDLNELFRALRCLELVYLAQHGSPGGERFERQGDSPFLLCMSSEQPKDLYLPFQLNPSSFYIERKRNMMNNDFLNESADDISFGFPESIKDFTTILPSGRENFLQQQGAYSSMAVSTLLAAAMGRHERIQVDNYSQPPVFNVAGRISPNALGAVLDLVCFFGYGNRWKKSYLWLHAGLALMNLVDGVDVSAAVRLDGTSEEATGAGRQNKAKNNSSANDNLGLDNLALQERLFNSLRTPAVEFQLPLRDFLHFQSVVRPIEEDLERERVEESGFATVARLLLSARMLKKDFSVSYPPAALEVEVPDIFIPLNFEDLHAFSNYLTRLNTHISSKCHHNPDKVVFLAHEKGRHILGELVGHVVRQIVEADATPGHSRLTTEAEWKEQALLIRLEVMGSLLAEVVENQVLHESDPGQPMQFSCRQLSRVNVKSRSTVKCEERIEVPLECANEPYLRFLCYWGQLILRLILEHELPLSSDVLRICSCGFNFADSSFSSAMFNYANGREAWEQPQREGEFNNGHTMNRNETREQQSPAMIQVANFYHSWWYFAVVGLISSFYAAIRAIVLALSDQVIMAKLNNAHRRCAQKGCGWSRFKVDNCMAASGDVGYLHKSSPYLKSPDNEPIFSDCHPHTHDLFKHTDTKPRHKYYKPRRLNGSVMTAEVRYTNNRCVSLIANLATQQRRLQFRLKELQANPANPQTVILEAIIQGDIASIEAEMERYKHCFTLIQSSILPSMTGECLGGVQCIGDITYFSRTLFDRPAREMLRNNWLKHRL